MEKTEIEKLDLKDLEALASDQEVSVPRDLGQRTARLLGGLEQAERRSRRPLWAAGAAAALLAAVAGGLLLRPSRPRDTYDDPALAYAAVEAALGRVRQGMTPGARMIVQAQEKLEKPSVILDKINRK